MTHPMTQKLLDMLAAGKESSMLRLSLGKACLDAGDAAGACEHLQRACELDPQYSVAWKLLGKAQLTLEDGESARAAWTRGLEVAQAKGDAQVVKELQVFLRRLDKAG